MTKQSNHTIRIASWAAVLALCCAASQADAQQISYGDYLPKSLTISNFGQLADAPFVFRGQDDALPPPPGTSLLITSRSASAVAEFGGPGAAQRDPAFQKSESKCDGCGKAACDCCCALPNCCCCPQTTSVYAEYLYLHTSGTDMVYAIPQDGIGAPGTVPIGRIGTTDHTYESGARVGVRKCLSDCAAVHLSYTWFESSASDRIQIAGPNVLNPVTLFPGTFNAGFAARLAVADSDVRFQMADIDYRFRWKCSAIGHLDLVLGARYGHLEQDFTAIYFFAQPDGTTIADTQIEFDGVGLRIGLDGERCVHSCSRLKVYGKTSASVLSGSFKTDYVQTNQFNGTEAVVQWEDDRFVPILEGELGIALDHGHFRVAAGYQMAAWFNAITTPVFVDAVKAGNYTNVQDTITFDGLVGRVEFIW